MNISVIPCAYCTKPDVKAREIIGNEYAFAFPTNIPVVPGHMIIAPRRCVLTYQELTSQEKEAIEELRVKMNFALKKAFGATGFNYAWNEDESAGQSVPHFHLQMLPRKEGDVGITKYEPREFLYRPGKMPLSPEEELNEICELVKSAL